MRHLIHLVFAGGLLWFCCAKRIPCTVTQDARGTLYSIPEFKGTKCEYYWTNSTDHVLANHKDKLDKLVVSRSNRTLLTNDCITFIVYKRDCLSEGVQCMASCVFNCSRNGAAQLASSSVPSIFTALLAALLSVNAGKYF